MRSVFFSALALVALGGGSAAQETPIRPVVVMEVSDGATGITRQFFGSVAARSTVDLAFQVPGQILTFDAIEGEFLAAGDIVAQLDLEPFELALAQAQLRADQADRALERLTRLQGSAVSQVTVDDAATEAELARVALRSAELDLQNATLRAPFDALIASRNVANFSTIAAGTPVVRLHDMSDLRIEIDVPEVLFQQAGEDPDVDIYAQFPSATDQRFPVEVREFNAEASAVGQSFRLTLGMAPPPGLAILPGSSATIVATVGLEQSAMQVPPSAVALAPDGATSVFVFQEAEDGTGTVHRRAVELGADQNGAPTLVSGVESGELVVIAGVNDLQDGQVVRRFDGFPD